MNVNTSMKTLLVVTLVTCFQVAFAQKGANETASKEQNTKKNETNIKAKNPKASYLDIFHASQDSAKLHRLTKTRIFGLKVAVQNFGSAEDRGTFENIVKDFKAAVGDRYRGSYVASDQTFRKNMKNIKGLYTSLANLYYQRTQAILDQCADALVETELQESAEPGSQIESKIRQIDKSRAWLRNGYSQLNEGEKMQLQERPEFAISHYRVAKMYGIGILKDLSANDAAKKKVENEYLVDSKDIKRLVAGKVSAGK